MSDQTQAQAATEKPADSKTEDAPGAQKEGEKSGEKLFTQAELDAIVKDRLDRAKAKAETEAAKAREKATADALAEQGEFKKLSETQAKQLLDLTTEKETLTAQLETANADARKYRTTVESLLAEHIKTVPENIKMLLDKLDPIEQLNWLAANQGAVKITGVPATPKADGRGPTAAEQEARQKEIARAYQRTF